MCICFQDSYNGPIPCGMCQMMEALRVEREASLLKGPAKNFIKITDEVCPKCGGDPSVCWDIRDYDPISKVGAIVCKKSDEYIKHTDWKRWQK